MPLSNKNILAIDDAEAIRKFLRIALEVHGARFHAAATASGGLALCEQLQPDLVVLDLGLPDKEGLKIIPLLKNIKKSGMSVPVVVLTARKERHMREEALQLGADAYITKPFIMEELIEAIEERVTH